MASRKLGILWRLAALTFIAAFPAAAQSFRVQCPTSTITHPDPNNSGVNNSEPLYNGPRKFVTGSNGFQVPPARTREGAITCQQVSGGGGYSAMANGTQTYMFSFGPLSGLADIAQGL